MTPFESEDRQYADKFVKESQAWKPSVESLHEWLESTRVESNDRIFSSVVAGTAFINASIRLICKITNQTVGREAIIGGSS